MPNHLGSFVLLASSSDFGICCGVIAVSMVIGGVIASILARKNVAGRAARERMAKVGERARYNRIKVNEAQARGQAVTLCELCGGTGTWQGRPDSTQDCPRCLGLGLMTGGGVGVEQSCPRCRQPLDGPAVRFCGNCGLEIRH